MPLGFGDAIGDLFAREQLDEAQRYFAGLGLSNPIGSGLGELPLSAYRAAIGGPAKALGGTTGLAAISGDKPLSAYRATSTPQGGAVGGSWGSPVGDDDWVFPVQGYQGGVNLHWGSDRGASDIFAAPGTPVLAARGGTVTGAGFDRTGGNYVSVRGDDGLEYYYAHLKDLPAVRAGQSIARGAYLGGVGETGNAAGTGAHLHFGAGRGIQTGTGPRGGSGLDFDAVAALSRALAGGSRPTTLAVAPGGPYQQMAAEFAREAGIDPNTFVRQIQQESSFNPSAVSPAGARGIAQIVPQYHPGVNPDDPQAALRYAANLMARNAQQYGGIRNALIAYNAGPGGLQRYQRTGVLPTETQRYLRAILGD